MLQPIRTLAGPADAMTLFGRHFDGAPGGDRLAVALLDNERRLIALLDYPDDAARPVLADALALGARAIITAQAGMSSEEDIARRIADAAAALDIRLLDHLVLARGAPLSFRALGLI